MTVNESTRLARAVVAELVKAGVEVFVLCPGSRSAPLAYALYDAAAAGTVTLRVETDERVAGFVALGAGVAGRAAAVVTTSGSAVANLHPAVEEAAYAGVAMVVLAADRPHERRGVRASQTADHRAVLGGSVRFAADIPAGAPQVRGQITRAVHRATGHEPGPVLINVAFREPLMPQGRWESVGRDCAAPRPQLGEKTVVVAGPSRHPTAQLTAIADHFPVLAEPTSALRCHPNAVAAHPYVLRSDLRREVDSAIVVGHPTLTREVSGLLADPGLTVFAVDEGPGYTDAAGTANVVQIDEFAHAGADPAWLSRWREVSTTAEEATTAELALLGQTLAFPTVARALTESAMPMQLAASSIIRAVNIYGIPPAGRVYANRGLAGIDGTISTARGTALALGEPVRVVVGDLAFVHDVGALIPGRGQRMPGLDVVVIDDHGGSIFASLEYGAGDERAYDAVFRTEKRFDVEAVARAADGEYARPGTLAEFAELLGGYSGGTRIVHVDLGHVSMRDERRAREERARRIVQKLR